MTQKRMRSTRSAFIFMIYLVGAQRFELWTSWSRTMDQRHVYNLQARPSIATPCAILLVIKDFAGNCCLRLAMECNGSMQGVGTKVGTMNVDYSRLRITPGVVAGVSDRAGEIPDHGQFAFGYSISRD